MTLMPGDRELLTEFVAAEREKTGYPVEPCHAGAVLIHKALGAWSGNGR